LKSAEPRPVPTPRQPLALNEALPLIRAAIAAGNRVAPADYPQTLDRSKIARMVSVFQPRQLDGRHAEDEAHIAALVQAIGSKDRPKYLDPVVIWWGGDRWYVIDGHHRLDAYKRAEVQRNIPVVVFEGSLDEAMAQSAASNSKDRLVMRLDDKLNFAWRLVLISNLSKRKIVDACAVGNGTVGNMRTAKETLLENPEHNLESLVALSWRDAKDEAAGREKDTSFSPEDAVKQRAQRIRLALYKSLGPQPFKDPEAFALALSDLDSRFPERLMRCDAWFPALRETIRNMATDYAEAKELEDSFSVFDKDEY
jgi:ParB-like chromosome segregation protein Spo0J